MLSSTNSDNETLTTRLLWRTLKFYFFLFVLHSETRVVENLQRKYEKEVLA